MLADVVCVIGSTKTFGTGVGVTVAVAVAVLVAVAVGGSGVGVAVAVAVAVGGSGVGVLVAVAVAVGGSGVGVLVAVVVAVAVAVGVAVAGGGVGVAVGVAVGGGGVGVTVGVEVPVVKSTSSLGSSATMPLSLVRNLLSPLAVPSARSLMRQPLFAVPSTQACTSEVTVQFTQPMTAGMVMASVALVAAVGWLFHVTVVSAQDCVTCRTSRTRSTLTFVRQSVSVAELTVAPAGIEETSKATNERFTLVASALTAMSVAAPKLLVGLSSFT